MKKLTAERAQERIAHLKQWQEQRGLTLREEEYLEALEGYLPILQQREQPEHGDNAWVQWEGGRRPVQITPTTPIEVVFRNNSKIRSTAVHHYEWRHFGKWSDIIAYRIIPEHAQ